jgi:adenylylsulfate kinase
VIWYTGLSGAGKSTIARAVHEKLTSAGVTSELLDGDAIRAIAPTGFSRADRDGHVKRVGFLASRLEHHGVAVHCALISPYAEVRDWVRQRCRRFVEVYVATPLAECERRDVKGLYAAARRGDIKQFTGIDDPYEPPSHPELTIDTSQASLDEAVARVIAAWETACRSPDRS